MAQDECLAFLTIQFRPVNLVSQSRNYFEHRRLLGLLGIMRRTMNRWDSAYLIMLISLLVSSCRKEYEIVLKDVRWELLFLEFNIEYVMCVLDLIETIYSCLMVTMGFKCPEWKGVANFLQEVTSKKDQKQYWTHRDEPYRFLTVKEFVEGYQSFHVGRRIQSELAMPFDNTKSHPAALSKSELLVSQSALPFLPVSQSQSVPCFISKALKTIFHPCDTIDFQLLLEAWLWGPRFRKYSVLGKYRPKKESSLNNLESIEQQSDFLNEWSSCHYCIAYLFIITYQSQIFGHYSIIICYRI